MGGERIALVPPYDAIGKAAGDITKGFQYQSKLGFSTKTSDGVALSLTGVPKGDSADLALKTAYVTKAVALDATFTTSDKILVNATYADLAPGLKLTGSFTLPDQTSGKLGVIYANPYVNLKTVVGLTTAPKVDVWATTSYQQFLLGGTASFSTAKSELSNWTVALGYMGGDSTMAAFLDKGNTLRLAVAQQVSADKAIAAEISRDLISGQDVSFALSHQRRLANGVVTKYRLDQAGLLSFLYSTALSSGEKLAVSAQVNTLNLSQAPRWGFALDLA